MPIESAAAAAAVKGGIVFADINKAQTPFGKRSVAAAVHTVYHHFTEKSLGLSCVVEKLCH